jgi:hypothetical protein
MVDEYSWEQYIPPPGYLEHHGNNTFYHQVIQLQLLLRSYQLRLLCHKAPVQTNINQSIYHTCYYSQWQ